MQYIFNEKHNFYIKNQLMEKNFKQLSKGFTNM